MSEKEIDPVPANVRALLALFEEQLPAGGFPDVDAQSLLEHIRQVEQHHQALRSIREQLTAAQAELDAQQAQLLKHAQRGEAYAAIFAEGDEALSERVRALGLSRSDKASRQPTKRKRKSPKAPARDSDAMELPLTADADSAEGSGAQALAAE